MAAYPVVYQVTKSTTRQLGRDCGARRKHPLATVQARLLAVDFYSEARRWPAEFILDHAQKIATFTENGCPWTILPRRGGRPYLREEFLLWLPDGRLGIAIIDQPHIGAFSQMLGLVRRFAPVVQHWGEGILELLIVSGNAHRHYVYRRLLRHPRVLSAWPSEFELAIRPYCVLRPTQPVAALLCPACLRRQPPSETPHDHTTTHKQSNPSARTKHVSPSAQKQSIQPMPRIYCDLID